MKSKLKILLVIFVLCTFSSYAQEEGNKYENLDASEFYNKMESNPESVVLDVRFFSEYNKEHIPGSLIAEKKSKLISLTDTLNRQTPIFVYCDDGDRSETVCEILTEEQGFKKVYNLEKGLIEWKKQGLPLNEEEISEEE